MNSEELKAAVASHTWWHRIDLGNGIVTPGQCPHGQTDEELSLRWGLPSDLTGKSVLDIGCWDGLFSVACLRRGARRVAGIDVIRRETFRLVMDAVGLGTKSTHRRCDAQDPLHYSVNVALCFGVIYHVERPLEVIRNAVLAASELVLIETALAAQVHAGNDGTRWVQVRGHDNDRFNVWYPTPDAVVDAMQVFGCVDVQQIYELPGGTRGTFMGRKAAP